MSTVFASASTTTLVAAVPPTDTKTPTTSSPPSPNGWVDVAREANVQTLNGFATTVAQAVAQIDDHKFALHVAAEEDPSVKLMDPSAKTTETQVPKTDVAKEIDAPKAEIAKTEVAKADIVKDVEAPKAEVAKTEVPKSDVAKEIEAPKTEVTKVVTLNEASVAKEVEAPKAAKEETAKASVPLAIEVPKPSEDTKPTTKADAPAKDETPTTIAAYAKVVEIVGIMILQNQMPAKWSPEEETQIQRIATTVKSTIGMVSLSFFNTCLANDALDGLPLVMRVLIHLVDFGSATDAECARFEALNISLHSKLETCQFAKYFVRVYNRYVDAEEERAKTNEPKTGVLTVTPSKSDDTQSPRKPDINAMMVVIREKCPTSSSWAPKHMHKLRNFAKKMFPNTTLTLADVAPFIKPGTNADHYCCLFSLVDLTMVAKKDFDAFCASFKKDEFSCTLRYFRRRYRHCVVSDEEDEDDDEEESEHEEETEDEPKKTLAIDEITKQITKMCPSVWEWNAMSDIEQCATDLVAKTRQMTLEEFRRFAKVPPSCGPIAVAWNMVNFANVTESQMIDVRDERSTIQLKEYMTKRFKEKTNGNDCRIQQLRAILHDAPTTGGWQKEHFQQLVDFAAKVKPRTGWITVDEFTRLCAGAIACDDKYAAFVLLDFTGVSNKELDDIIAKYSSKDGAPFVRECHATFAARKAGADFKYEPKLDVKPDPKEEAKPKAAAEEAPKPSADRIKQLKEHLDECIHTSGWEKADFQKLIDHAKKIQPQLGWITLDEFQFLVSKDHFIGCDPKFVAFALVNWTGVSETQLDEIIAKYTQIPETACFVRQCYAQWPARKTGADLHYDPSWKPEPKNDNAKSKSSRENHLNVVRRLLNDCPGVGWGKADFQKLTDYAKKIQPQTGTITHAELAKLVEHGISCDGRFVAWALVNFEGVSESEFGNMKKFTERQEGLAFITDCYNQWKSNNDKSQRQSIERIFQLCRNAPSVTNLFSDSWCTELESYANSIRSPSVWLTFDEFKSFFPNAAWMHCYVAWLLTKLDDVDSVKIEEFLGERSSETRACFQKRWTCKPNNKSQRQSIDRIYELCRTHPCVEHAMFSDSWCKDLEAYAASIRSASVWLTFDEFESFFKGPTTVKQCYVAWILTKLDGVDPTKIEAFLAQRSLDVQTCFRKQWKRLTTRTDDVTQRKPFDQVFELCRGAPNIQPNFTDDGTFEESWLKKMEAFADTIRSPSVYLTFDEFVPFYMQTNWPISIVAWLITKLDGVDSDKIERFVKGRPNGSQSYFRKRLAMNDAQVAKPVDGAKPTTLTNDELASLLRGHPSDLGWHQVEKLQAFADTIRSKVGGVLTWDRFKNAWREGSFDDEQRIILFEFIDTKTTTVDIVREFVDNRRGPLFVRYVVARFEVLQSKQPTTTDAAKSTMTPPPTKELFALLDGHPEPNWDGVHKLQQFAETIRSKVGVLTWDRLKNECDSLKITNMHRIILFELLDTKTTTLNQVKEWIGRTMYTRLENYIIERFEFLQKKQSPPTLPTSIQPTDQQWEEWMSQFSSTEYSLSAMRQFAESKRPLQISWARFVEVQKQIPTVTGTLALFHFVDLSAVTRDQVKSECQNWLTARFLDVYDERKKALPTSESTPKASIPSEEPTATQWKEWMDQFKSDNFSVSAMRQFAESKQPLRISYDRFKELRSLLDKTTQALALFHFVDFSTVTLAQVERESERGWDQLKPHFLALYNEYKAKSSEGTKPSETAGTKEATSFDDIVKLIKDAPMISGYTDSGFDQLLEYSKRIRPKMRLITLSEFNTMTRLTRSCDQDVVAWTLMDFTKAAPDEMIQSIMNNEFSGWRARIKKWTEINKNAQVTTSSGPCATMSDEDIINLVEPCHASYDKLSVIESFADSIRSKVGTLSLDRFNQLRKKTTSYAYDHVLFFLVDHSTITCDQIMALRSCCAKELLAIHTKCKEKQSISVVKEITMATSEASKQSEAPKQSEVPKPSEAPLDIPSANLGQLQVLCEKPFGEINKEQRDLLLARLKSLGIRKRATDYLDHLRVFTESWTAHNYEEHEISFINMYMSALVAWRESDRSVVTEIVDMCRDYKWPTLMEVLMANIERVFADHIGTWRSDFLHPNVPVGCVKRIWRRLTRSTPNVSACAQSPLPQIMARRPLTDNEIVAILKTCPEYSSDALAEMESCAERLRPQIGEISWDQYLRFWRTGESGLGLGHLYMTFFLVDVAKINETSIASHPGGYLYSTIYKDRMAKLKTSNGATPPTKLTTEEMLTFIRSTSIKIDGLTDFEGQRRIAESWRSKLGTVSWKRFGELWGPLSYVQAYVLFHLVDLSTVVASELPSDKELRQIYEYRLKQATKETTQTQLSKDEILTLVRAEPLSSVGFLDFERQRQLAESLLRPKIGTLTWSRYINEFWRPLNYAQAYVLFHLVDLDTIPKDAVTDKEAKAIYAYRLDQASKASNQKLLETARQMTNDELQKVICDATKMMNLGDRDEDLSKIEQVVATLRTKITSPVSWDQFKALWMPMTYTHAYVLFYFVDLAGVSRQQAKEKHSFLAQIYDKRTL